MGWLHREVTKSLGGFRSLKERNDHAAERQAALAQFADLGQQVVSMSRFGDHGMPVWEEEHHGLSENKGPLVTATGLPAASLNGRELPAGEAVYTASLNGDVDLLRTLLADFLSPAEGEEAAAADPAAEAEAAAPAAASGWRLVDRYGWEMPAVTAAGGHLEALTLLLEAGCDPDARNLYSGWTAST